MNYIWNIRILWTLLQFLKFAQPYHKEYTIAVSSTIQLECDDGLKVINNIDVTVRRNNTTCLTTSDECTLPDNAIESINDKCNKQVSCKVDIHDEIINHGCLQDYGYFNVWYTCKTIIDLSCDFEATLCDWLPLQTNNIFHWKRGLRPYYRSPKVDHTTASRTGSYVYTESFWSTTDEGDTAKLESGYIVATQQQCLSFWYFKTSYIDSLYILQNDNILLQVPENDYDKWNHIQIPLQMTTYKSYKLGFEVKHGSYGSYGTIVIDDILIENQKCNSSFLKCDFDSYPCDWNNDDSNKHVWKKQNGEPRDYHTGPSTDHSTASDSGYYMYLESIEDTVAILEFQRVDLNGREHFCLTFWYHLYQDSDYMKETLNVTLDNELVWTENGNQEIIDDISLAEGTCTGLLYHEEMCVPIDEKTPKETECPKGYLNFADSHLLFDPEKQECSQIYNQTKNRLLEECKKSNESETCLIDLSTDTSDYPECFQLYDYHIIHTCEDQKSTPVSSDITSGRETSEDVITVYAVVVSTLVIIIVAVSVFAVIVCHFKKRAKSSKPCNIRQHTSVREMIDFSGYNIINYNKMTGITISDIDNSKLEANATNRQPQDINTAFKQEDTIGNKYESLSTNRNPSEHAYESDPIHSSQYQTLTKQRESEKHFYESTEPAQAQAQDNKTLTGQEDEVCHKYESLSTNQNSVEHAYESDVLHLNQYQTLTTQRELDKHLYESTEPVQKQNIQTFIKQEDDICNRYESLSTNRNPYEHAYASDQINTNQYESLTKQRESDKHVYESTEHATKQEDEICNEYESLSTNRNSNEHAYETDSIHTNQYQTLKTQRESDKHFYESTEHALRVSMD